jgi:transposase
MPRCVVVMETGTHSRWVSRQLSEMGFDVLVGNSRKIRSIWDTEEKDDDRDAEQLARLGRFDRRLLHPVQHRDEQTHQDLEMLHARDMLVGCRSKLAVLMHSMWLKGTEYQPLGYNKNNRRIA